MGERARFNEAYLTSLRSTKVLLIGAKRTGIAAANALEALGVPYAISDRAPRETVAENLSALTNPLAPYLSAPQDESHLNGIGYVIVSPGVPLSIPLITEARRRGIPVVGDVEFVYRLVEDVEFLAITGTDGKTTTTALLGAILSTTYRTHTVGNIGVPIAEKLFEFEKGDRILLELSSFQLEAVDQFRPRIAAILNLSQDHLDRYPSMDAYFAAKKRIVMNQRSDDYFITNADNPYTKAFSKSYRSSRAILFSLHDRTADVYIANDFVCFEGTPLFSIAAIRLMGDHNRENVLAATAMGIIAGVPAASIERAVNSFAPVPHRLEFVREYNGARYYNDSKATTLQAVIRAVDAFDSPVILIMGGRNKGIDFAPLTPTLRKHAKLLILTGEAAEELAARIDFEPKRIVPDFDAAVEYAKESAAKNDVVLLSPGCASFDRFKNYEARGDYFKSIVMRFDAV